MKSRRRLVWKLLPFYLTLAIATAAGVLVLARVLFPDAGSFAALAWWSLVLALAGGAAGFAVIWRISRSLEQTRAGARRFADGDLNFRLDVPESEELGGLAETLNQMAAQLDERIHTINQQRYEQEAMLGSMVEGVIAVDSSFAIIRTNVAAAQLLGARPEALTGRSLPEIIRNRDLHLLLEQSIVENRAVEGEVTLHGETERSLQVHCTSLRQPDGVAIGALIVLHDITRLRRLERVRRDFVANVSHELKTPLTSIKGFVETLMEGALDQPEEARRFCGIIAKQVDRLQAIIEDLLSLSRVEQEVERDHVAVRMSNLHDILTSAAQCVTLQASEKNIQLDIRCPVDLLVPVNAPLMEQVAVNLIDNAVKYSDPGKTVTITAASSDAGWEIRFTDQGCGIDPQHLGRIFERFYRVDKARSRKAGGTGLGLAIVKHIVTAHGGRIAVESQPRAGSTFTVFLPRRREKTESHTA